MVYRFFGSANRPRVSELRVQPLDLMKNVQISFDERLLKKIDTIAASWRLSRSAIVREALHDWLRKKELTEFEHEWISKLKEQPDDPDQLEPWRKVEHWEDA